MPDRGGGGDLEPLDPFDAPGRSGATTTVRPTGAPPRPSAPSGPAPTGPAVESGPARLPRGWIALGLAVVLVTGAIVSSLGDTDDAANPTPDTTRPAPVQPEPAVWARIATPSPRGLVQDIVVDGDDVVAVGSTGGRTTTAFVWVSHDAGESWERRFSDTDHDSVLHAVARAPWGGFVAVGERNGHPIVLGCDCDGGDDLWRTLLSDDAVAGSWTDIVPLGDALLALGQSGGTAIAARTIDDDGAVWVRTPAPTEPVVSAAGVHGGRAVAVGDGGRIWTSSPDGRTWAARETSIEGERYLAIASTDDALVAVAEVPGDRLRVARTDADGTAPWTWIDPLGALRDVDPRAAVHLAADATGVVLTGSTRDGEPGVWIRPGLVTAAADWERVADPPTLFGAGDRIAAAWAGDGRTWLGGDGLWARDALVPPIALLVTPDPTFRSTLQEVDAFAGGRAAAVARFDLRDDLREGPFLVAVGTAPGGTTSAAWRSADGGLTWTAAQLPDVDPGVDDAMTVVATEPVDSTGGVVAIRRTELDWLPWWSHDGSTWAPADGDAFEQGEVVESVVGTLDGWVAVGWSNAWGAARAWRSADGLHWERVTVGADADACCLVLQDIAVRPGGGLVAVGTRSEGESLAGVVMASPDGRAWTELTTVDGPLFAVAATASGGYVALGRTGQRATIWWSDDLLTWDVELLDEIQSMRDTALAAGPAGVVVTNAGEPGWIATTVDHDRPMRTELVDAAHVVADVLVDHRGVTAVGAVALVRPHDLEPGFEPERPGTAGFMPVIGWADFSRGPLLPGYDPSVVATDDELVVWGGTIEAWDGGTRTVALDLADGAAWDPGTRRWRTIARSPIAGRAGADAVWTGEEVMIWGGRTSHQMRPTDGARYDPDLDAWTAIPPAPRARVGDCGIAWTGTELVVPSVQAAYNPVLDTWRDLPRLPGLATWCAVATSGGEVYALGAGVDRVDLFALAGTEWTPLGPVPLASPAQALLGRRGGTLAATDGVSVAVFDPATGAWGSPRELPLESREPCGVTGLSEVLAPGHDPRLVVSSCTGVAVEQADGSWFPFTPGHDGRPDAAVVLVQDVIYAGSRALTIWGNDSEPIALGPTTLSPVGDAVTVVGGADGITATVRTANGRTCTVATTVGDAAALVGNVATEDGASAVLVRPAPRASAFPAVRTDGGRTLTWAHDPATLVTVRCEGGDALAVAQLVGPPTQLVPSGG